MQNKILIISNNCLSKHNSNGRTLLNLLGEFNTEELFQFYVANEKPTENACSKFLQITDKNVIKSYFSFKKRCSILVGNDLEKSDNKVSLSVQASYGKKTVIKSFVRDFIWNTSFWVRKKLVSFVKENNLSLILLQAGDNVFLHRLARKVAKKCNLPLVIYNTEDYYFKDYNYMNKTLKADAMYKCYSRAFRKEFKKTIASSSLEIYNCVGLQKLYNQTFNKNGKVIYSATDFKGVEVVNEDGQISYAGNLGCGRHKALINVANALQKVSKDLFLEVYGPANEEIINDFKACTGIRYNGLVPYEKVCEVIRDSKLLIHVESFEDYYKKDTKYAFSTKLADYGASNVPVFVCAPTSCETTAYILENDSAFIATNLGDIEKVLKTALFDNIERDNKRAKALSLSRENNDYKTNGKLFREFIEGIINGSN